MRRVPSLVALATASVAAAACAELLQIDSFSDGGGGGGEVATPSGHEGGSGTTTQAGTATGSGGLGGGVPNQVMWARRFGDSGDEHAAAVGVTSSGSIVLGGDFTSGIDFGGGEIQNPDDDYCDAFVTMLTPDGEHDFTDAISGSGEQRVDAIAITSSNAILVAGWYTQQLETPGAVSWGAYGGEDLYLMKLDGAGSFEWAERATANGEAQRATGIADGASSEVVTTGYFGGTITIAGDELDPLANYGPDDGFVALFTTSGAVIGSEAFGVWGHQRPEDVAVLADGSIVIVGDCSGGITDATECSSPGDVFVVKYDGQAYQDNAVFGDAGMEYAHAVATDGDDLVVVGDFDSHIDFGAGSGTQLDNSGSREIFVAKLHGEDFSHAWSHSYGGQQDDIAYDVAIGNAGQVVVTGVVRGSVDLGHGLQGSQSTGGDAFVLVLATDGSYLWSRRFDADGDQEGRAVAVDSNDDVILFGNMEGTIDFGVAELTSSGGSRDVFVAKLRP